MSGDPDHFAKIVKRIGTVSVDLGWSSLDTPHSLKAQPPEGPAEAHQGDAQQLDEGTVR